MQNITRLIRTFLSVAVTTAIVVGGAMPAMAATVTSANDYPSRLQTSVASNHKVVFTTPSGVSEGETITLTFSSDFDTSSITEDDVDVEDDSTDLTTAADCTGSEEASVEMASDVLTITICSGDGGAIAATSEVTIEIGDNAAASGTGSNQVTNPSDASTNFITIGGTFGDSGSIAIPVHSDDDTISVTATVPSSGGGGGGGGESSSTPSDSSAPTISDIVVIDITASTARVTWTTDESATSAVDYGATTAFELGTVTSSIFRTSHGINLNSLPDGSVIFFRVRSADSRGNQQVSETTSFTTLDETGPVISDIEVVDIGIDSATITWTTDESADSTVSYGTSTSYSLSESSSEMTTSHSVTIEGLDSSTEYHFQVTSADSSENETSSDDETFTTDEDLPPSNVSGLQIEAGDAQLSLSWTNPEDEDLAGVRVLVCTDGFPGDQDDEECTNIYEGNVNALVHDGLTNGTTYYYGVFAYDNSGQFASGAIGSATPTASEEEVPSEEDTDDASEDDGGGEEDSSGEESPSSSGATEDTTSTGDSSTPSSSGSGGSCGDNQCSESESVFSCPSDCQDTSTETDVSLGAETDALDVDGLSYLANTIELTATSSGVVDVLPNGTLSIRYDASEQGSVDTATVSVGTETYLMRRDDALALYVADVMTPSANAVYKVTIVLGQSDGSQSDVSSFLRVVESGYVYEDVDGEEAPVTDARVTLFSLNDGSNVVWDGSPYNQANPFTTGTEGVYGYYVPNGTYQLRVEAGGYETNESGPFIVTNSIVNSSILMIASFEEEEIEEESAPVVGIDFGDTVIADILESPAVEAVQETLETIRELPGVETASVVSTPTLAVTAGASVVVMTVAFDFLPLLQYFFTAPVLFFWRRKRKGYGRIYNAISKQPVDLAMVRLFALSPEDEASGGRGRLVKSRVTDAQGRYYFLASPGRYRLEVRKAGFDFPTAYLKGETADGEFLDLYHGEVIEVTGDNAVITANIPLDPSQADAHQAPAKVKWRKRLRLIQHTIAVAGVLAAIVFAILRPTWISFGMVGLQVVLYLASRRIAKPVKPISWGIVYDGTTGRPVSNVVARIFEPRYNKVLETQVTDSKGRYAFILGPNQYYAAFKKDGFNETQVRPIDYSDKKEAQSFAQQIFLYPQGQVAQQAPPPAQDQPKQ